MVEVYISSLDSRLVVVSSQRYPEYVTSSIGNKNDQYILKFDGTKGRLILFRAYSNFSYMDVDTYDSRTYAV